MFIDFRRQKLPVGCRELQSLRSKYPKVEIVSSCSIQQPTRKAILESQIEIEEEEEDLIMGSEITTNSTQSLPEESTEHPYTNPPPFNPEWIKDVIFYLIYLTLRFNL